MRCSEKKRVTLDSDGFHRSNCIILWTGKVLQMDEAMSFE